VPRGGRSLFSHRVKINAPALVAPAILAPLLVARPPRGTHPSRRAQPTIVACPARLSWWLVPFLARWVVGKPTELIFQDSGLRAWALRLA